MQVEDYSLGQCIGKGSFGEVYLTTKKGINKLFIHFYNRKLYFIT